MNDLLDGPVGVLLMIAALWLVGHVIDSLIDTVYWFYDLLRKKKNKPKPPPEPPSWHKGGFDHPV
jgi:hypothetical protein